MKLNIVPYAALLGLFVVLQLIANPIGNFPLNDDWNYARNVKHLLDQQSFLICTWAGPSALLQAVCGWLACLTFGFSFNVLHLMTNVFALVGIFLTNALLSRIGSSRITAFLGATCLMVNPLYFLLANTFMTDVPFFAVSLLSCLLAMQTFTAPSLQNLTAFNLAVFAGSMCRQLEIIVPFGFVLPFIRANKISKTRFVTAIVPLLVSIASVAIYHIWVKQRFGDLWTYRAESAYLKSVFDHGLIAIFTHVFRNTMIIFCYLGVFVFPFILANWRAILGSMHSKERNFFFLLSGLLCVLIIPKLIATNQYMPFADNVLISTGIGPLVTAGSNLDQSAWPVIPIVWPVVTIIGICSGSVFFAGIITALIRWRYGGKPSNCVIFICSSLLLYFSIMALRGFFDRYLIWLIPFAFTAIRLFISESVSTTFFDPVKSPGKSFEIAACCVLVFYAAFSVASTHDYFSWNRARWQLIDNLVVEKKIPGDKIDGGNEYNGWITYDSKYVNSPVLDWMSLSHSEDYVISLLPKNGYHTVESLQYPRWMPPGEGRIYSLKRD